MVSEELVKPWLAAFAPEADGGCPELGPKLR